MNRCEIQCGRLATAQPNGVRAGDCQFVPRRSAPCLPPGSRIWLPLIHRWSRRRGPVARAAAHRERQPDQSRTMYSSPVPELSRFFGIVIRMFVEAGGQHHRAHFHAYYQEHAAVFAVDTIECLGGSLPKAQQRLVDAWAEIHRADLQHDWELLQSGQPPVKIEPLR
jgi:hypothetical protein